MKNKKSNNDFIKRAREIHGNKYDYSKTEYNKSSEKVCIICPEHGEFWQEANSHLRGCGCPKCRSEKMSNLLKSGTKEFIEKAKQIHGDKYDYSKVNYINNCTKVCIICPKHGEFWQTPNDHLSGYGCGECGGTKKMSTEKFIEKARKIHGGKYDYSKVEYVNNKTKVCIICPEHGEFLMNPNDHLCGHGCPNCGGAKKLSKKDFIEKAMKVHDDKYDYSKVEYINNKTKICIICPEHGEFWQTPNGHLNGQGCPNCKESHLERSIHLLLEKNEIKHARRKRFLWLGRQHLDFYLPDYNIAIECQGEQHYKSVNIWGGENGLQNRKKLDDEKKKKCEEHNIKLIYVGSDSYSNKYNIISLTYFDNSIIKIINNTLKQ